MVTRMERVKKEFPKGLDSTSELSGRLCKNGEPSTPFYSPKEKTSKVHIKSKGVPEKVTRNPRVHHQANT